MNKSLTTLAFSLVAVIATAETPETDFLKKRTAEFRKDVVQVAGNVYTATGYSVQPVSMIVDDVEDSPSAFNRMGHPTIGQPIPVLSQFTNDPQSAIL